MSARNEALECAAQNQQPQPRATHTPGPWAVAPHGESGGIDRVIVSDHCWIRAIIQHDPAVQTAAPEDLDGDNVIYTGRQLADMQLMAAGPDLLKAVRSLLQVLPRDPWFADLEQMARQAIDKATNY